MALTNKKLAGEIETVCLITTLKHAFLSSSIVKEVAVAGGCVDQMVPPYVAVALRERFKTLGADGGGKVQLVSLRD
jgi:pantetheine-phosphate adenylyltransferase